MARKSNNNDGQKSQGDIAELGSDAHMCGARHAADACIEATMATAHCAGRKNTIARSQE